MKVKHLIEALQKCDPEEDVRGVWEGTHMTVNAVSKQKDGMVNLHVDDLFYEQDLEEGENVLMYDPWRYKKDGSLKGEYGYDD